MALVQLIVTIACSSSTTTSVPSSKFLRDRRSQHERRSLLQKSRPSCDLSLQFFCKQSERQRVFEKVMIRSYKPKVMILMGHPGISLYQQDCSFLQAARKTIVFGKVMIRSRKPKVMILLYFAAPYQNWKNKIGDWKNSKSRRPARAVNLVCPGWNDAVSAKRQTEAAI